MQTYWQIDKSCMNVDNTHCVKINVFEVLKNDRLLIRHPIDNKRTRVKSESEKYIFLNTEKALKWLELTLKEYGFNSFFWQQTATKIEQVKANEQATKAFIYLIDVCRNRAKSPFLTYHYELEND